MAAHGGSRLIGAVLLRVDRATSTNDLLRDLAARGAREGTVVVAREQSGGRGRRGRPWLSPPGGLWLSLLLRPPDPADGRIGLAVAVGVAEAVRAITGAAVGLKWPNDLMLDERKVGGILVESAPPLVIVGIGVNANVDPAALPAETSATATSLAAALGREVDLDAVLAAVLAGIDDVYGAFRAGHLGEILARWRDLSVTLGRPVQVRNGAEVIEGTALDIDNDGALLIERSDGGRSRVIGGDVTVLAGGGRA